MLLTIESLLVQYGKQTALHITEPISIDRGERIGIIGSNGAGKSTLVKSILGLTNYRGKIITELKPEEMAVHMQNNSYVNTMAVRHIMESFLNTRIKNNKRLQELIAFFEFEKCLSKKYSSLSGGQKQRFTVIMVMIQDAPLTFYDEMTSGLDFETRQRLMEKLANWYRGKENTLCIVSHYYEELEQLADKLLILDKGRVVAFGSKEELCRTYCGNAVLILEQNQKNEELTRSFPKLKSPAHLIALPCRDKSEERERTILFVDNNVNFKRSSQDIEIMTINAKESRHAREGDDYEA